MNCELLTEYPCGCCFPHLRLGEDYFLEDVEGGVFGECAVGNLRRLRIDVGRVCLQVSKKRKLGIFGSGWTTLWQRSFSFVDLPLSVLFYVELVRDSPST